MRLRAATRVTLLTGLSISTAPRWTRLLTCALIGFARDSSCPLARTFAMFSSCSRRIGVSNSNYNAADAFGRELLGMFPGHI